MEFDITNFNIWNTPGLRKPSTDTSSKGGDLVSSILSQKLHFSALTPELVRQLLRERQSIRDSNKRGILDSISNVIQRLGGWKNQPYNPNSNEMINKLSADKAQLERLLEKEDKELWKDTLEIRQELLRTERDYQSTSLRSSLVSSNDEDKDEQDTVGSG